MVQQDARNGVDRKALAAARARLVESAAQALKAGTLTDHQVVRIRLALKRGRSARCGWSTVAWAARTCIELSDELART